MSINYRFATEESLGSTFTSDPCPIHSANHVSISAIVSGASSPVGTFTLECSNDKTGPVSSAYRSSDQALTPGNFVTIDGSSEAISGNGTTIWNLQNVGFNWVRLVYTRTSGSATLDADITLKTIKG